MSVTRRGFVISSAGLTLMAQNTSFDYVVIGAGVFGAWISRHLTLSGAKVLLLDQYGPSNNRASSGGETRIIRMGYGPKQIYTEWSWRALRMYQDFYATVDPMLFQRTGFLWMCRPDDDYARANIEVFKKLNIPHEKLERSALDKRFPQISFGPNSWGIYEPDAGVLLARRGVQTVVRETQRLGLTYALESVLPPSGTRTATIRTIGGATISAKSVIYACGPWLPKLFPDIIGKRINPTRQEVLYFGLQPADPTFRAPQMPSWVDGGDSIYGLPDVETRGFKVAIDAHGPTVDPDTQERLVPASTVEKVREYFRQRFPKLASAPLAQTEVCQ